MMPEEEPLPRKRRSLLGAPAAQNPEEDVSESPAPAVRERTTPVTEAIPRRVAPVAESADQVSDRGAARRSETPLAISASVSPPASATPAGSFPTPPTRDRTGDAWFLASGQSPPERSSSGDAPVVGPPPRNPWLWAAPIAGVGAVGLLFVLVLVAAVAFFG